MRIQVITKGGATFEFEADEFTHSQTKISWTSTGGTYPKLLSIRPEEVSAIVRITA